MRRLGWFLYFVSAAFAWSGFASWRSDNAKIFHWSVGYSLFLASLLAVLALPVVMVWAARKLGRRRFLFAMTPAFGLLALAYAGGAVHHYVRRTYPFDPFLQLSPPQLALARAAGNGEYRVLMLGGSTTREKELPAKVRYPAVLERLLHERRPDLGVVALNAGMEWYTTKHSLIDYVTRLREWRPQTVVILHGINDLYRSCTSPQYVVPPNTTYEPDWSHFYGPAVNAARPPTFERFLYDRFFANLGRKWWTHWRVVERDYPVEHWVALPDYEEHLRQLIHYIHADLAKVILVTQPMLLKADLTIEERRRLTFGREFCDQKTDFWHTEIPSPVSLMRGLEAFNDATRRIAHELSVPLVDAARALPRNPSYFRDDVHFRPVGAAKVAELVAVELAGHLPPR